jgi:hypothetical protein
MTVRSKYRFVDHHLTEDPSAEAETHFSVQCVAGDERDCGAHSGPRDSKEAATDWSAGHHKETGHNRFLFFEAVGRYAMWEPAPNVLARAPGDGPQALPAAS